MLFRSGFKFGCSAHFPGAVEPPANPNAAYRVKINGSYRKDFKHAVMHEERPARRPTGAYLAPGTIATVRVPASLVGKGYQVRVGAHSWDNTKKPRVLRLDRSSLVYPIDAAEIRAIEDGTLDRERNPLTGAPHTAEALLGEWDRPYSREQGCYPKGAFRVDKYWPPVSRIDGAYGDRNLVCTCPPVSHFADDVT